MRQPEPIPGSNGRKGHPVAEGSPPVTIAPGVKEIPYDYVATFKLEGRAGNRVPQVINISTDGAFVAVAIGYSFIPARWTSVRLPKATTNPDGTQKTLVGQSYQTILTALLKIAQFALYGRVIDDADSRQDPNNALDTLADLVDVPRTCAQSLLIKLWGIDFKYSVIDSGTGRELQNQPIHNIAGLGEPTGERPFRPFAKPMVFMPRSTIRIEVEEVSEGLIYGFDDSNGQRVGAQLYIVLHGYKLLGYGAGRA